jgi:hypothetical protein
MYDRIICAFFVIDQSISEGRILPISGYFGLGPDVIMTGLFIPLKYKFSLIYNLVTNMLNLASRAALRATSSHLSSLPVRSTLNYSSRSLMILKNHKVLPSSQVA